MKAINKNSWHPAKTNRKMLKKFTTYLGIYNRNGKCMREGNFLCDTGDKCRYGATYINKLLRMKNVKR
jgi:hypothetical protein